MFLANDIHIHGDTNLLNQSGCIIMSNHFDAIDFIIIARLFYKNTLYTVIKHDLAGAEGSDKILVQKMLSHMKDMFYASCNFIAYIRNQRESGAEVKNSIVGRLRQPATNILLFPDGGSTPNGRPVKFKNGIFHLAADNQVPIIPLTIIYKKMNSIGGPRKLNLLGWFDQDVCIHIHAKQSNSDFNALKESVFTAINSPFQLQGPLAEAGQQEKPASSWPFQRAQRPE